MKKYIGLSVLLLILVGLTVKAIASEYSFSDISRDSFDKQQICVHHDSFLRGSELQKWHIGGNADEPRRPLDYYSPRSDYETIDDGFFIEDGQLKNNRDSGIEESFRLLNVKLSDEFVFETSIAGAGKAQRFVFNFESISNYDALFLLYKKNRASVWLQSVKRGAVKQERITKFRLRDNNVRLQFIPTGFRVLNGDSIIKEFAHKVIASKKVGISIEKRHNYEYNFFNVFNIVDFQTFDDNHYLDHFVSQYPRSKVEADLYDYSYSLVSNVACNSSASERFELHQETCKSYKDDRVERVLDIKVNTNLRRMKISFDIYLPQDYLSDDLYEILFQVHEGLFGEKAIGRIPSFSVRTQKGKWQIWQLAADKREGKTSKDYLYKYCEDIGPYTVGKWTHFDINIKEGYEKDHNPYLEVFVDGRIVYTSYEPNCYNTPWGGYIRYGIYKAEWLSGCAQIGRRCLYVDNMKIQM